MTPMTHRSSPKVSLWVIIIILLLHLIIKHVKTVKTRRVSETKKLYLKLRNHFLLVVVTAVLIQATHVCTAQFNNEIRFIIITTIINKSFKYFNMNSVRLFKFKKSINQIMSESYHAFFTCCTIPYGICHH